MWPEQFKTPNQRKKGHDMNATAQKRQAPSRKVMNVRTLAKLHVPEPQEPVKKTETKPKDRGEKPRFVGMRNSRELGIDFRAPGEPFQSHINAEQIGLALIFIRTFRNAENAKTALDEVAKLLVS